MVLWLAFKMLVGSWIIHFDEKQSKSMMNSVAMQAADHEDFQHSQLAYENIEILEKWHME